MTKTVNGKTYYTLKESSDILDINIEKEADLLVSELKLRKNNNLMHV